LVGRVTLGGLITAVSGARVYRSRERVEHIRRDRWMDPRTSGRALDPWQEMSRDMAAEASKAPVRGFGRGGR
jgi:hypothetical protein